MSRKPHVHLSARGPEGKILNNQSHGRHLPFSRPFHQASEGRFGTKGNMILSTTPSDATLYSIVNVIGKDLIII